MASYDDDLRLAHVLADAVERVTMDSFRSEGLEIDYRHFDAVRGFLSYRMLFRVADLCLCNRTTSSRALSSVSV